MSLKLVKNAHVENNQSMIEIRHYDTIIFSFDPISKKAIVKADLSKTSNDQIKYAKAEFQPLEIEIIDAEVKWSKSGEYFN